MTKKKNILLSKEISFKKKNLKKLIEEKRVLELKIKNSNENIKILVNEKISDNALNKLPIESLKELYIRSESFTDVFKAHSKERKDQLVWEDKIKNLEYKIQEAQIDLTIEKINTILKNLN